LIEALDKMDVPNKMLVCIGMSFEPIQEASFPIILTGLLTSYTRLSKYSSAADYFISNSYEETFGQTLLESLACGTPVITTPCSGSHDLINQENGVVCSDFTVEALVECIKLAMSREYNPTKIREDVINRFSYDKIAQQYIELYKKVLAQ
jgi:glycosyltransferase involved in cell wall biosynthesis